MNTERKNTKKIVIALLVLVVVMGAMYGIYQLTRSESEAGQKEITIQVIHGDGTVAEYVCETSREYLVEVLRDEDLVEGEEGEYGLFITTVDGETVDDSNQEWWCITKGGEMMNTSADQTPISDGDNYELTLTVGY